MENLYRDKRKKTHKIVKALVWNAGMKRVYETLDLIAILTFYINKILEKI